jgi:hypothetical protein
MRALLTINLCLLSLVICGCARRAGVANNSDTEANRELATTNANAPGNNTESINAAPTSSPQTDGSPAEADKSGDQKTASRVTISNANDTPPKVVTRGQPVPEKSTWCVLSISGEWVLKSPSPANISRGDKLPSGSIIWNRNPDAESYITLIDKSNHITRKRCASEDCNEGLTLQENVAADSTSSRIIGTIIDTWSRDPGSYENLISRGQTGGLQDAVVELKDGKIDLSPAFSKLRTNLYFLQFKTLKNEKLSVIPFEWSQPDSQPLQSNNIKPGLYIVALMNSADKYSAPLGPEVWILVSAPGQFGQANRSFQNAWELTQQWGNQVAPHVARSLLRAYLNYLATGQ